MASIITYHIVAAEKRYAVATLDIGWFGHCYCFAMRNIVGIALRHANITPNNGADTYITVIIALAPRYVVITLTLMKWRQATRRWSLTAPQKR